MVVGPGVISNSGTFGRSFGVSQMFFENKSNLSKLSTLREPFIVKFIENQSEHLSKLTLYHPKKRATRRSRRAREPSRIPLLFLRGLNKKTSRHVEEVCLQNDFND